MTDDPDEPITTDELIEAFDGDLRAVIEALIVMNNHLMQELDEVKRASSYGYTRGHYRGKAS